MYLDHAAILNNAGICQLIRRRKDMAVSVGPFHGVIWDYAGEDCRIMDGEELPKQMTCIAFIHFYGNEEDINRIKRHS